MKFSISSKIIAKHPNLKIGVIVIKKVDNSKKNELIENLLRRTEEELMEQTGNKSVNDFSHIQEWKEVHKSFGNNPKRYAPSVLAIVKRVLKGGHLPSINPLVDLYNYISLKYVAPVGGEDLDQCDGDIILDFARGDEEFFEIGSTENKSPIKGEIVYKDNKGVLCRKFNWREADRTKLTEDTKNAIIVIEALNTISDEELNSALDDLRNLISEYCEGEIQTHILKEGKAEVNL